MIAVIFILCGYSPGTETPAVSGGAPPLIRQYCATIVTDSTAPNWFTVHEAVTVNQGKGVVVYPPPYRVQAVAAGIALERVIIPPPHVDANGNVTVKIDHQAPQTQSLCEVVCPSSTIQVTDLPSGAFYRADDETVRTNAATQTWSASRLDGGITFTYVSNPWVSYRGVIRQFLGVSSIGRFVSAIFVILWAALGSAWFLGIYTAIGVKARDTIEQKLLSIWQHLAHLHSATASTFAPRLPSSPQRVDSSTALGGASVPAPVEDKPARSATDFVQLIHALVWPVAVVIVSLLLRGQIAETIRELHTRRPNSSS